MCDMISVRSTVVICTPFNIRAKDIPIIEAMCSEQRAPELLRLLVSASVVVEGSCGRYLTLATLVAAAGYW